MFQKPLNAPKPTARRISNRAIDIETLETRRLLSAVVVTTNSDALSHTGLSLRDAVVAASAASRAGISDTITFAASLKGQVITLTQGMLEVGIGGAGAGLITIMGNQVTVNGNHASRVFFIDLGVAATFAGLSITGGGTTGGTNGAGIFNSGALTISNSTFYDNSASLNVGNGGGAVENFNTMTIVNSTFYGNSAGQGGAIYNHALLTVTHSTFSGNVAVYGGGINCFGNGSLTLLDSIVAGNTASAMDNDITGVLQQGSNYNLIGYDPARNTIDPRLGPLAYYGGTTKTMALLKGSPAINTGGPVTKLSTSVNPTQTTLFVNLPSAIACTPGSHVIKIDNERIQVTNVTGTSLIVTRGYNGTTAANHLIGAPVILATDQNGRARAGAPDIGAYESTSATYGSQVVTTASDAVFHTGVSLRDAIGRTELDAANGHSDTITFASTLNGKTITLAQGQLELAGAGTGVATIDGANQITVSANHLSRVLFLDAGVHAAFKGLTITGGGVGPGGILINGAGVFNYGVLSVSNSTFSDNFATDGEDTGGGAINNAGTLTVDNTTFSGNGAPRGGAIYNHGALKVSNSTFSQNFADDGVQFYDHFGGGIFNFTSATLTVVNCSFYGNPIDYGGGIWNDGTLSVANSTFGANGVGGYGGGGIYNNGAATVVNSLFNQNFDVVEGAGIDNWGTLSLSNSTLVNGEARVGGGLHNAGVATVSYCTFSGNHSFIHGGGIAVDPGSTLTLLSTIVAGNHSTVVAGSHTVMAGPDIFGAVQGSSVNNLIGINSGMTGISNGTGGNLVGTSGKPLSAGLLPLANNGGPTLTMALTSNSIARNAGGRLTTLTAAVSATATIIPVGLFSAIAITPGSYVIKIDSEELLVTNGGLNVLFVLRGYNGTTAAAHANGAKIYLATDQRGHARSGVPDIGAYEA